VPHSLVHIVLVRFPIVRPKVPVLMVPEFRLVICFDTTVFPGEQTDLLKLASGAPSDLCSPHPSPTTCTTVFVLLPDCDAISCYLFSSAHPSVTISSNDGDTLLIPHFPPAVFYLEQILKIPDSKCTDFHPDGCCVWGRDIDDAASASLAMMAGVL